MNQKDQTYFNLFLLVPILFIVGIFIYFKPYDRSKIISFLAFFILLFIIFRHLQVIYKMYKNVKEGGLINKELGLFFVVISIGLLFYNSYILIKFKPK